MSAKDEKLHQYEFKNSDGNNARFMLIGLSKKIMLCLYEDKQANSEVSNSPFLHLGINVENFEEALRIAQENGLVDQRWGLKQYKKSRSFYIEDPNGLQLEVSEVFVGGH